MLSQLRSFHDGLDSGRRTVLYAAGGVSMLTILAVSVWASQPTYVALTRAADADERGHILSALDKAGIPSRTGRDGVTVEVLAEKEVDARRAAAGDDGIIGLDGLDQLNPWLTPVQEQLHKQRMMQGELVRAINGFDGIAKSSVHLNVPNGSEFLMRDDKRASAAVTLRPDDGRTLTPDTGKSVAELVAHSVTGMTSADVEVIDQSTGRILYDGGATALAGNDERARAEQKRAAELSASVQNTLARLLGSPDDISVSVSVELNSATVQSTVDAVDPESASPTQEKIESEGETSATATSGAPGTDSNLPERSGGSAPSGAGRKRDLSQTAYLYTRTSTTTLQPGGDLKRISAAVFVNSSALARMATAGVAVDEPAVKAEIEKAVRAALGADEKRGDTIVVSFAPFAVAELSDAVVVPSVGMWERFAPPAVAALAILLAFFGVIRPLVAAVTAKARGDVGARTAAAAAAAAIEDDAADASVIAADGKVIDLGDRLRRHVDNFKPISSEEISQLVRQETDNSAEVLRRWMRG